jgi:hypothetical protein
MADEGKQTAGDAWGDDISKERKAELEARLRVWEQEDDHGERRGPFDREFLTGADVMWLAARTLASSRDRQAVAVQTNRLRDAQDDGTLRFDLDLPSLHLEGAHLRGAYLEGANLIGAWLDSKTNPSDGATIDRTTCLGDIHWSGLGAVDLTQVNWNQVPTLGDERGLGPGLLFLYHLEAAVRAYRQISAQLRSQGLSELADRFSERAQICQRKLLFHQMLEDWRRPWRLPGDLLRCLFSGFLAVLAGYGYHPGRTLLWYFAVISGFAFAYFQATHGMLILGLHPSQVPTLKWYEALVLSVSAFHGRGFFQPVQSLGDPVAILAASEAIIGLFIEISFIATFTQRFFGSK